MRLYERLQTAYRSVAARSQPGAAASASARLTFSITAAYPDKVLESPDAFRVVGKASSGMLYSFLALPDEHAIMKEASAVKAKTIDALAHDTAFQALGTGFHARVVAARATASRFTEGDPRKAIIPYIVAHDVAGYGPLSMLLDDPGGIEEIMVNAPTSNIVVHHSQHGYCKTNLCFNSAQDFRFSMNLILAAIDTELCENRPVVDAQLYDGSRLHAQLSPYAVSGAAASIRLNSGRRLDLKRLMSAGTVSADAITYLWMAVLAGVNMVVAGAPASGKTTLLLALHDLMPAFERIITIEEDVNELKPYGNFANTAMLQGSSVRGRYSVKNQVINALHLRPDRLIIGELRGEEAAQAFFGANVGVPFLTTIHATSNGAQVASRLSSKPMNVQAELISMLDASVFMERKPSGERRLSSIAEYSWLSRSEVEPSIGTETEVRNIIEEGAADMQALKDSKVFEAYSKRYSVSRSETMKSFRKRLAFITMMSNSDLSVYDYIRSYGDPA
jgi:Flp pilus assembly CpaF family ATPase